MYRDALIHDTSCDSQDLSLIFLILILFFLVYLVFILFYSLGQCLPALLNLVEAKATAMENHQRVHGMQQILVP